MKIVVLAGGYSPERDVSLSSGCMIANSLISSGYEVALIDPYIGLENYSTKLFKCEGEFSFSVTDREPNLEKMKKDNNNQEELIGKNVLKICKEADIVFIALHGGIGENGQLQATFDNYNIKYTGSGYIGSLLAMDKDLAKRIVKSIGIPTADWTLIDTRNDLASYKYIPYPCFVKPTNAGSSVGVFSVNNIDELKESIEKSKVYGNYFIAEKTIKGREFSVGVLDKHVLPAIEIIPSGEFYDYKGKYIKGLTTEICPTDLNEMQLNKIQSYALSIHEILRLKNYSRIDFIMDEYGEFFFLEANTLPGMTPTSLFPQEAAAVDINFDHLCIKMINIALNNFE